MQCYTELAPPTAVSHVVSLPFLSAQSSNLIVAKTALLQLFSIRNVTTDIDTSRNDQFIGNRVDDALTLAGVESQGLDQSFLGADVPLQRAERSHATKLVIIAEYNFPGIITSLASIQCSGSRSGGEVLIVSFLEAKLSLIGWDPESHSIHTISIHSFEREDLHACPWAEDLSCYSSNLTVDTNNRCAALKFGPRRLAILPFRGTDEDLAADDYDHDMDGDRSGSVKLEQDTRTIEDGIQTPYHSSFLLALPALDPDLVCPIYLSFLYEYHEPTFGILSAPTSPTSSLLSSSKDPLVYTVFTLDLDQHASTTLLSVPNLPYDLQKIIPLAPPVGGALLLGENELIHIDQSGKANGIGVNIFAREISNFPLADHSDLEMRLEGCVIAPFGVDDGEMLMVLSTGEMAILTFKLDGRTVSGLAIRRVDQAHGGSLIRAGATCAANLGHGKIFLGSANSDSVLLAWTKRSPQNARKSSVQITDKNAFEDGMAFDLDDQLDDDFYAEDGSALQKNSPSNGTSFLKPANIKDGEYVFRINDTMPNISPLSHIAFGRSIPEEIYGSEGRKPYTQLELAASIGAGRAGAFVALKRSIAPKLLSTFENFEAHSIWAISAKRPLARGIPTNGSLDNDHSLESIFDRFVFVSKVGAEGVEDSAVGNINSNGFEELKETDFGATAGATIEVGTLASGTRVVQVLNNQVVSFDGNLGLAQIYGMPEEATGAQVKVVSASFADPFLLLVRDDSSVFIIKCDDLGEIDEAERGTLLLETKWISGSLYRDRQGVFASPGSSKSLKSGDDIYMFLASAEGGLYVYAMTNLKNPVYVAEGLSFLPPVLTVDYTHRRSNVREIVTEILVVDLGELSIVSPYLIVRTATNDLAIYEPFQIPSGSNKEPLSEVLRFFKIPNPYIAQNLSLSTNDATETHRSWKSKPLRAISNVGGFSAVFLSGENPSFIMKSAATWPRIIGMGGTGVRSLSGYHTTSCEAGLIYVDINGTIHTGQFPAGERYTEIGWATRKVNIGEEIQALAYHDPTKAYVLSTSQKAKFELPKDDDFHKEWAIEDLALKPITEQGVLRILNPASWTTVFSYNLEPNEVVLTMKDLKLETSENNHRLEHLIAVGTSISRGVDLAEQGNIYIFSLINVVPKPDEPETNLALKLIAQEKVKGAVTALSSVGTQGFLLAAQGQKCMVRGLKEDGSLLPVAFIDMQCHVTVARALPGSGLCLMGDALKGIWFVGYTEEPYKMTIFGKSPTALEVMAADFLPEGNSLYIVAADANRNLHIFQYDPEHPKSATGQRLLHRSVFHVGYFPSTLTQLPSANIPFDRQTETSGESVPKLAPQTLLHTTASGTIGLIVPLPEASYSLLQSLSTHLISMLDHPAGLNPRAWRAVTVDGMGGRPVLDGGLLARYFELGCARRAEVVSRAVGEGEGILTGVRNVLAGVVGGNAIAYL